ncbi:MAG: hypothetical protein SO119_05050 [Phascolarctobacterium sp.]|nr:hypothetical protein [Phascolarctobacterium sp.]
MWDNILGHQKEKEFLARYLEAQERPHALLFVGPSGLGKKKLALEFAKALLCEHHNAQDHCEACRLMNLEDGNLSHPDFLFIKREPDEKTGRLKDISKEQILDLISKTGFAPVMSETKVCVIEDVDRMGNIAPHTFLKVLEEPPVGWVMVLIATDESKLLSTILSRVVCLRFQPVPLEDVEMMLRQNGVPQEKAAVLARISEGSIGKALALADEDIFDMRKQAKAFLEALPLNTPFNYLSGRIWQQKGFERPQALLFTKLLQLLLRDILMQKLHLHDKIYNCDLPSELAVLARGWKIIGLKLALASVQEAFAALENNVGIRVALESMALKIDEIYKE